jgi:hypothetical protein
MSAAPRRDWVEIVATLLLALAAVATAWSSYQASRWNGDQAGREPGRPPTPFAMPEYRLASTAEAERLDQAAAASSAAVSTNIQHATNYVLGCLLFLGTVSWIATFPVSLSV